MAKSATHFQPTVDTFGELTLRARRLGSQFMSTNWATTWTDAYDRVDQKALANSLIMIAFVLSFVLFIIGVFAFDQFVFADAQQAVQGYYGGNPLPMDYH